MVLGHDVHEIVPGRFKSPAIKRRHVIRQEDVSRLRDLGKFGGRVRIESQIVVEARIPKVGAEKTNKKGLQAWHL